MNPLDIGLRTMFNVSELLEKINIEFIRNLVNFASFKVLRYIYYLFINPSFFGEYT